MAWRATVLTIFPEMFPGPLGSSLAGEAITEGKWALAAIDIRGFATDKHRSVDDAPSGGGAGMVMRADIAAAAIDAARAAMPAGAPTIYLSPRGYPFMQEQARELAGGPGVILLCGRFEGIDERVLQARNIEEISIGDYVLSGGEIAAQVVIDAVVRLLTCGARNENTTADGTVATLASRARKARSRRRASPKDSSNILTTRAPANGRDAPSLGCCCQATIRRSPNGGVSKPKSLPRPAGLTCGRHTHTASPDWTRFLAQIHRQGRKAKVGNLRESSPPAIQLRINQKEWRSPQGHEPGRRPPKSISHEHHRTARERAACGSHQEAEGAGFRSRRYAPRQRQGGRGRAQPRAGRLRRCP